MDFDNSSVASVASTTTTIPEILITQQNIAEFNQRLLSHPSAPHKPFHSVVKASAQRWVNMSSAHDEEKTKMHLAFQKLFFVHTLFKKIEKRAELKKQLSQAKEALSMKKRSPKQILNLIHFHTLYMEDVKDINDFTVFAGLTMRKQLQIFYKHIKLCVLEPNTPIFLQSTPATKAGKYFVILSGSVKLFSCESDKRCKEIIGGVNQNMLEAPCETHNLNSSGYLGKCDLEVEKSEGFGGCQILHEKTHVWNQAAVSGEGGCELICIGAEDYDNFLYGDHFEKFKFSQRIRELGKMKMFTR